jgi:hypothetical protein
MLIFWRVVIKGTPIAPSLCIDSETVYNSLENSDNSGSREAQMKNIPVLALILTVLLVSTSCAPGPNPLKKSGETAGFWLGIWHGLIAPITFIVSLFDGKVNLYEVHNSGGWYNFGFVLGAGLFLSGGILGRRKKKK